MLGAHWEKLRNGLTAIDLQALAPAEGVTLLARSEQRAALVDAPRFRGTFERNWAVGSFTSLTRQTSAAPMRAQHETLLEEDSVPANTPAPQRTEDAPWHRFPRGSVPGNFLHEQLEWMGQEGFAAADDEQFAQRLGQRCERAGWGHRREDAVAWLRTVALTRLPQLGASLSDIVTLLPEMEFWFPSEQLNTVALDALCGAHLLDGAPRPALPERELHGMLKGFADLVFEHEGRYWVLDSSPIGSVRATLPTAAPRWQPGWRRTATTSRVRSTCWHCTGC